MAPPNSIGLVASATSRVNGIAARLKYERYAPRTITTRSGFEAEIRRIQGQGYAIDDEELRAFRRYLNQESLAAKFGGDWSATEI